MTALSGPMDWRSGSRPPVGGPRPACPVRGRPSGPPCARGFCGVRARVRPLPASGLPPSPAASLSGRLAGGLPLAVRGFGPRPGPWVRFAPLRRVGPRPGSVGLGLPARSRARRSGPPSPPPPRRAARAVLGSWAAGAVRLARAGPAPCPPSARACYARPRSAPGAAGPPARLRLWRGPPFRPALPLRGGRLRPRSSARGAAAACGGVLAAFAAPRATSAASSAAAPDLGACGQEAYPPWHK